MENKITKGRSLPIAALILITALFCAQVAFATEKKIPESHPITLLEKPRCTECHIDDTGVALKPIETFIHSPDWIKRHMFFASETSHLCNACHGTSFCLDCHADKDELEPADKYSGSVDRWLPHRGDYLYQHRIDGRLDPTACFRCHGRQNNRTCKRCHR